MKKYKFYYSIVDTFPPFRVDIVELFGMLKRLNMLDAEWYMSRHKASTRTIEFYEGQKVNLPIKLSSNHIFARMLNKCLYWVCDIASLLRCLFKPIDLIQVRDKYLAAIVGLIVARLKGAKFVYWCSYPFPEHDFESYLAEKSIKKYFYYLRAKLGSLVIYRVVMPRSDHVFVQSEQMKSDIVQYGISSKLMTAVPMGVPQRLLEWTQHNQIEVVKGRVVYLGTLAAIRQLHVLIDAFSLVQKQHPVATLLIVGDGTYPYEKTALEAYVDRLGLTHAVKFTGFVPISDAWSYSASASVCVSPFAPTKILASTSPTKLMEYMALGRPVVCNSHPEQSEIIQQSGAGLCVNWGAHDFAQAILWMLQHPEEAEAMGKKGPDWVAEHRTYHTIASDVWHQYLEILREKV
jgi:glycosyltransferase involved in cell wall biosynthesis